MKKLIMIACALSPLLVHGQDDLVRKLESNKSYTVVKNDESDKKYHFTNVIDLEHTSVQRTSSKLQVPAGAILPIHFLKVK